MPGLKNPSSNAPCAEIRDFPSVIGVLALIMCVALMEHGLLKKDNKNRRIKRSCDLEVQTKMLEIPVIILFFFC